MSSARMSKVRPTGAIVNAALQPSGCVARRLVLGRALSSQGVCLSEERGVARSLLGDRDDDAPAGSERIGNDPCVADRDREALLGVADPEQEDVALAAH